MLSGIILIIVILLLVSISVRERILLYRYREKDWSAIGEAKSSPLSQALVNLVGVAGGIYLSLILIATFMDVQVPEHIHLGGLSMEPLAAVSILMAVAQPFMLRIISAWKKI